MRIRLCKYRFPRIQNKSQIMIQTIQIISINSYEFKKNTFNRFNIVNLFRNKVSQCIYVENIHMILSNYS